MFVYELTMAQHDVRVYKQRFMREFVWPLQKGCLARSDHHRIDLSTWEPADHRLKDFGLGLSVRSLPAMRIGPVHDNSGSFAINDCV